MDPGNLGAAPGKAGNGLGAGALVPSGDGTDPEFEKPGWLGNCLVLATEGGNAGLNFGTGGITFGCTFELVGVLAGMGEDLDIEGAPREGALLGPYRLRLNSGWFLYATVRVSDSS